MRIPIVENILSANERLAAENERTLEQSGVLAVNIMSSPGAGKTSLIVQTIKALASRARIGVIEGDVASRVDADTIEALGIPVVQINTGGTCHLDANMIKSSLDQLPLDQVDLLFIENVGNLICPTDFALGEALRVMISSIPEGDDKPYKYPAMFAVVDAIVINKIDLLPYVDFDLEGFRRLVVGLNSDVQVFEVSCKTHEGIDAWADWLLSKATAESAGKRK
ncbi:MAG TPA: hydrogenase nickel incorporation protein HypB [Anaerolineae bacterium]|nr:hydrogenase nickel incorporation protein HypB [Anaerolineae bacterium]